MSTITQDIYTKIQHWASNSTAHGFNKVLNTKSLITKLLWLFFLLLSFSFCSFMIYRTFNAYFQYEVTTTMKIIGMTEMPYPQIQICDTNPLPFLSAQQYILKEYYYDINSYYYNYSFENFSQLSQMIQYENWMTDWIFYKTFNPLFNKTLRKSFGNNLIEFGYLGYPANLEVDDDSTYYDSRYGNCRNINSGYYENGTLKPLLNATLPSQYFEFQLWPNSPTDYDSNYHSGIVLKIADQIGFPLLDYGIYLPSGTYSQIRLTKTVTDSLPYPYSDCQDANSVDTLLARELRKLNLTYTRRNCMTLCRQKLIIDELGCYDMTLPPILGANPCTDHDDFYYLNSVTENFSECFLNCPFECHVVNFETSITNHQLTKSYFGHMEIEKTAIFTLIYDQLQYTYLSSSPMMTVLDLIANLGGTLGLFIGVSILSFVEIFELGLEILFVFFKSRQIEFDDDGSK
jgi:hypothetical protein